jgi:hypothetical protein
MSSAGKDENDLPNLRRAGGAWSDDEDEALVQELRDGLDLDDIAEIHGRTIGAIRSRVNCMVPDDEQHPTSGKARIDFLREQLAAGDYDWRTPLHSRTRRLAWSPAEDDQLRKGWETRTPLVELADAMRRSEPMLLRRLLQLGLAADLLEIVDRLGCDPRGPLPLRVAIAGGAAGPVVHILLGLDENGAPIHISLHESAQAARELSIALGEQDASLASWRTVERQIGGPGYMDPLVGFSLGAKTDPAATQ